jgi:hypothetical protein
MVAKPVVLRTFRWETTKEAKKAFRDILHAYALIEQVTNTTHDAMLRELHEQHPQAKDKTGHGVDHYYIGRTQQEDGGVRFSSGRRIWICRVNGSTADFGYNAAITGPSPKVDVKDALSQHVGSRRDDYRESRYARGSDLI